MTIQFLLLLTVVSFVIFVIVYGLILFLAVAIGAH